MKLFWRRMLVRFVFINAMGALTIFAIDTFTFFLYRTPTLFWLLGVVLALNTSACWLVLEIVDEDEKKKAGGKWYRRRGLRSILVIIGMALFCLYEGLDVASYRLSTFLELHSEMPQKLTATSLVSFLIGIFLLFMLEMSLLGLQLELKKAFSENVEPGR